jgi:hypothetical protein
MIDPILTKFTTISGTIRSLGDTRVGRMVREGEQLSENLAKLSVFLKTQTYSTLPYEEQSLLNAQYGAMITYLSVLTIRLSHAMPKG